MRRTALLFMLSLTLTATIYASKVGSQPLADVVSFAKLIFVGKVEEAELVHSEQSTVITYSVSPLETLHGETLPTNRISCSYSQVIPVKRDKNGKVIMRFSPIVTGSLQEFGVKKGEEWIFLGTLYEGKVLVSRVEKLEIKDTILKILNGLKQQNDKSQQNKD